MNATGNFKAGAVTPAKLLGEPEPERKRGRRPAAPVEEPINELWQRIKADREAREHGRKK